MRKAFTMIELLVVIGIIGILVAVLMPSIVGGTESARNAKCLSNLQNLAKACSTYAGATDYYPLAGSVEKIAVSVGSGGSSNVKKSYWEVAGWLSWYSNGAYAGGKQAHVSSQSWFASAYNQDQNVREYCYTNGTLWRYVSGNRDTFCCPAHVNKCRQNPPAWSYVMNSYFGWDSSKGSSAKSIGFKGVKLSSLSRADRRLLFAELPFMGWVGTCNDSSSSGTENDCTLQHRDADGGERIGFNHKSGKRDKFAHVVFADGHTEQIALRKGADEGEIKRLTQMLCEGKDVSFNGERYEELK